MERTNPFREMLARAIHFLGCKTRGFIARRLWRLACARIWYNMMPAGKLAGVLQCLRWRVYGEWASERWVKAKTTTRAVIISI